MAKIYSVNGPGMTMELSIDPQQLLYHQIFEADHLIRRADFLERNRRFVHYTSAETALKILENEEVWMRKANIMNDFMEIEHGWDCLASAYDGDNGKRFRQIIDDIEAGTSRRLNEVINAEYDQFRVSTYLTCISEHRDDEDDVGRLSMWRAYGGATGVALVLNPGVFMTPSDAIEAFTYPVWYEGKIQFKVRFDAMTDRLEARREEIKRLPSGWFLDGVSNIFRAAVLCTKHPGFHEEKEWRIIFTPKPDNNGRILSGHVSVSGTPQKIYRIPLKNYPDEGFVGAELHELINRIIVGPTRYPQAVQEAFVELLRAKGVTDAVDRVVISDIPLRND